MTDELRISLLAAKATAGLARTLIATRLHKWGCTHISDDAFLVVSELVSNASAATPGEEIRLRLRREAGAVLLAVWDASDRLPQQKPAAGPSLDTLDLSEEHWDDSGGWGLHIVAALAVESGYTHDPSGGKWVWARLKP